MPTYKLKKLPVAETKLKPWPIPPERIVEGSPSASGTLLHDGPEGSGTGIWECTPGLFDWVYDTHQSLCVVSGEAEVSMQSGERLTLKAGDAAFFPSGTRARWTVKSTLRKVYTTYR